MEGAVSRSADQKQNKNIMGIIDKFILITPIFICFLMWKRNNYYKILLFIHFFDLSEYLCTPSGRRKWILHLRETAPFYFWYCNFQQKCKKALVQREQKTLKIFVFAFLFCFFLVLLLTMMWFWCKIKPIGKVR